MSEQFLISVVIPVYNAKKYLDRCLASIVNQTYKNIEILLINDGSTDGSGDICKKWLSRDSRIQYYKQKNQGQGIARNKGIVLAKGIYITFIDADDWVADSYLEKLCFYLQKEDADICKCSMEMIDSLSGKSKGLIEAAPIDKGNALSYDAPHIAGNLYRIELFRKNSIRMPQGKYEDLATYSLLALVASKIAYTDDALYFYRIGTGNSTMDQEEYYRKYPFALRYLFTEAKRLNIFEKHKKLFLEIALSHLNACLKRSAKEGGERYYNLLKKEFIEFLDSEFHRWDKLYSANMWICDELMRGREQEMSAKVSILIPVYNVRASLEKCLWSVRCQTMKEIEIICIDDGSTDGSGEILEQHKKEDRRIIVIHKENSGYGNSMNRGLAVATGEYIGIVESDDFAEPNMFQRLYEEACLNQVDVVKSNYFSYYSSNENLNKFVEPLWGCEYNQVFSPMQDKRIFFASQTIWSAIYKRDFLNRNSIRFNETPGASFQDTAFTFKVWAMAERVVLIRDAFLHYCFDNENSSVQSSEKVFCVCDEYEEIEKYLMQRPEKYQALIKTVMALKFRTYRWNYERIDARFQYAFFLKFVQEFKTAKLENNLDEKAWKHHDWDELKRLLEEPEKYYRETTKALSEKQTAILKCRNAKLSSQGFLKLVAQYHALYICGEGGIGEGVKRFLKKGGFEKKLQIFHESKLYDLEFISKLKEGGGLLILAVEEAWQMELEKKVESEGIEDFVICGEEWKDGDS